MSKHGASRRCFIEADVKDFKSVALRTTTNVTRTGFELSVSQCDLFLHYRDSKEISFYYFRVTKLRAKHEKTCEFHFVGIMFVR